MTQNLLQMCTAISPLIGITAPTSIVGNQAQDANELFNIANTEIYELSQRGDWQGLTTEITFAAVGTEIQTGMIPVDFDRFISDTFWNRSKKRPLTGPLTAQQWQNVKAWSTSPVLDMFRQRGGNILITPIPTVGDTLAYEYISNQPVLDANGVTTKVVFAADTDTPRLPDSIVKYGLIWRFKKAKGIVYDAEFTQYENAIKNELGNDTPKTILNMANPGAKFGRYPGVIVPAISWPT